MYHPPPRKRLTPAPAAKPQPTLTLLGGRRINRGTLVTMARRLSGRYFPPNKRKRK
jgi:hypothetical protein